MTLSSVDIQETIRKVEQQIKLEKDLSPALKSSLTLLLALFGLLLNQLNLNSRNSSNAPSTDPNRIKKKRSSGDKKVGGQEGRTGISLQKVDDPDQVKVLKIDRRSIPKGQYKDAGYESRQVIDIDIQKVITEYRAQILEDKQGNRYTAPFPQHVKRPIQYGLEVKAHSVYMSQYQLLPYNRVVENFEDQMGISVSPGSVFNFNQDAYDRLKEFDEIVKRKLISSSRIHSDETGINIDGKRAWLHSASNDSWTYFLPHLKRGKEAMDEMGVLPDFKGVLCHDHWKPYFKYDCSHSLCNAHHLRELERAEEQDGQKWAGELKQFLLSMNKAVENSDGQLTQENSSAYREKYRKILKQGEIEAPPPDKSQQNGKRGRLKRSKSRNLLERLQNFEKETLRFMDEKNVPFTNNMGENDIRMTKVQQKISGCFRSFGGAEIFCRVRSYLSTCRKNDVRSSEALRLLFEGKLPQFFYT